MSAVYIKQCCAFAYNTPTGSLFSPSKSSGEAHRVQQRALQVHKAKGPRLCICNVVCVWSVSELVEYGTFMHLRHLEPHRHEGRMEIIDSGWYSRSTQNPHPPLSHCLIGCGRFHRSTLPPTNSRAALYPVATAKANVTVRPNCICLSELPTETTLCSVTRPLRCLLSISVSVLTCRYSPHPTFTCVAAVTNRL